MKKILILCALVAGLSSCAVKLHQYGEYGAVTDYSQYNMFISEATAVNFEYQPLGSVVAYVESGYANATANANFWGSTNSGYILATPDDAVRVLVENAQKIGAYGIINVKIKYQPVWNESMKEYIGTYTATGMAIKW